MSIASELIGFVVQLWRRRVKLRVTPFLAGGDGDSTLGIDVVNLSEFSVFVDTVRLEWEAPVGPLGLGESTVRRGMGELRPRQSQLYWFNIRDIDGDRCPVACVVRTECGVTERADLPSLDAFSLARGAAPADQLPRPTP